MVDYGSGNLASAARALNLAAERAGLSASVAITSDPHAVAAADRVVLPGQGAFADCARGLAGIDGMRDALGDITSSGRPLLGICVGMQLLAQRGLEHETTDGFGWIAGEVAAMQVGALRLPHMGWNELAFEPGHALLDGVRPGDHAYFVHSYALRGGEAAQCVARTDYGGEVVAFVAHRNVAGTQFHVEKSQETGLRILENFLRWTP